MAKKKGIVAVAAVFAASPQGRRLVQKAKTYATSPDGQRKLRELRTKLPGKGRPR